MVYSKAGAKPDYFPIDEDHPCEPDETYGLSKVFKVSLFLVVPTSDT